MRRSNSYWNDNTIISNLENIIVELKHFPSQKDLQNLNRHDLVNAITRRGGLNKYCKFMGYSERKAGNNYYSESNTLKLVEEMINDLGYFPSSTEMLSIVKYSRLLHGIEINGGIRKFRELLHYDSKKHEDSYWTFDLMVSKTKVIAEQLGRFPTHKEIKDVNKTLSFAIARKYSISEIAKACGYEPNTKRKCFWTVDSTIEEIKNVILITKDFPSEKWLKENNKYDLLGAIWSNGGTNFFRNIMNYKVIKRSPNDWTEEKIEKAIYKFIEKHQHFPTQGDLLNNNLGDLSNAISRNGGLIKYIEFFKATSNFETIKSQFHFYALYRGKKTEKLLYNILVEYCKYKNIPLPSKNIKLSKGNIVEFVIINDGKNIAIDTTNTKRKQVVSRKWTKKDYHKYVDEFHIVVFSDSFKDSDYIKWNNDCPSNVKVRSIYHYLDDLNFSINEATKIKIDKYCKCNFYNKDDLKSKKDEDTYNKIDENIFCIPNEDFVTKEKNDMDMFL